MVMTKTAAVRKARRARAEAVQARAASKPLALRVKDAGAKELAKLMKKHGDAEVLKLLTGAQ